jgi:glutamate-1-semialdehyde 2,1-aminomutase
MTVNASTRNIAESKRLYEEAKRHLVDGVGSGTRAPRSGWLPCPVFVAEGQGSHVTDVDGNTYIDYQMGQGPLILGHRPPAVIEAVTETLNSRGSLFALASDLEGEAATAVAARMPSVEALRFGQSGTECVMYALRFARAGTGRNLIVRFEGHYHGWSDAIHWSAHPSLDEAGPADAPAKAPASTGIPPQVGESLIVLPWADEAALDRAFDEHGDDIAGVICEPILGNCGGIMPPAGWLEKLREATRANGSMLIFDEVLTGLRVGPGGAQGLLGVEPDLTVMAKALAAGFPVAAIGGTEEAMSVLAEGRTMHGGTYNSNPLVCSAVIATMRETGAPGFYQQLTEHGERLAEGLVDVAREAGVEAHWTGTGPMFQLWFGDLAPSSYRDAQEVVARSPFPTFQAQMLERGVLLQPPQEGLFLSSGAHGAADTDETLTVAADVMPLVAEAIAAGLVGPAGGVR